MANKNIIINNNDDDYDYDNDSIHSMRIKEFLIINEQNNIQRPKCSISPINPSDYESDTSSSISLNSKSTENNEFLLPTTIPHLTTSPLCIRQLIPSLTSAFQSPSLLYPPLCAQSTPNKNLNKKVNFHSITDLAKSSSTFSNSSTSSVSLSVSNHHDTSNDNSLILTSNNQINQTNNSSFNDKLKNISHIGNNSHNINNKENFILPNPIDFFSNNNFMYREPKRKPRTQITRQHRQVLERVYESNKYPDSNEIEYLTHLLGFDENVIRIWFQNKRARDKLKRL